MEDLKIRLGVVPENSRRSNLGGSCRRTCLEGAAALIISLAFVATDVRADPVDFLFTGTGDGSLGGVAFTNRNFSVMISGDTFDIVNLGSDVTWIDFMPGTIEIDGLGVSTFSELIWVFRNDGSSAGSCVCVGFGIQRDLINVEESGLGIETWDMTTSFGPIFTPTPFFVQFEDVATDTGLLTFTDMWNVTFTATVIVTPIDSDGDGIFNEVDVDPLIPSTAFSDVLLGGITSATVVDPVSGLPLVPATVFAEVHDITPGGVEVITTSDAVGIDFPVACTLLEPVLFTGTQDPFSTVDYTCGSLTIDVLSGVVTVEFMIDGITHKVVVSEGGTVTLEDTLDAGELLAMVVIAEGPEGTVTVDGQTAVPGQPADVLSVEIDIKPGSFPNSINLGSNGSVAVAIFSSPTFDATSIDPLTVALSGAAVNLRGNGTPQTSLRDVNDDGLTDLIVHVNTQALELNENDSDAALSASAPGAIIRGVDTVRVVP